MYEPRKRDGGRLHAAVVVEVLVDFLLHEASLALGPVLLAQSCITG